MRIKWFRWKSLLDEMGNNNLNITIKTIAGVLQEKVKVSKKDRVNFWIAHCDFDITPEVLALIENTPGVETVTVFTAYAFRISIGKCFTSSQVHAAIEKSIGCSENVRLNKTVKQEIAKVKRQFRKENFWFIYVLPNGSFEPQVFKDKDKFISSYMIMKEIKKSIGGKILSSINDSGV